MTKFGQFILLAFYLSLVSARGHPRRQLDLVRRQAGGNTAATGAGATTTQPVVADTAVSSSITSTGGLLDSIASALDPAKSNTQTTTLVPVITLPVTSAIAAALTTTAPITQTKSSVKAATSSKGPAVVNITQTSTIQPSTSASPSTSAAAESSSDSSSGLSKGTLIAVIVIASAVGAVAAIWTIIRKWKLGPSRRFEDKLNPIDFVDTYGQPAHGVAGSQRDGSLDEVGLKRVDSWGSGSGSQRGAPMSESSYPRPVYPPTSNQWPPTAYQQPAPLANPYDHQPTDNQSYQYPNRY